MLTQVSDIEFTLSASALESALLESDTIKALRPPYNVQLSTLEQRVWYSSRDFTLASAVRDTEHPVGPLASQYSLRPLSALIELSSGAPSTPRLRAHAVGVSDLWTPDEAVFAAGWAELVARHSAALALAKVQPRHGALQLAKYLLLSTSSKAAEEPELADKPEGWDPPRVARHVERAVAQAYQVYRRARFLWLLHDCDIVYREPASAQARWLRVRDGALNEATDVTPDWLPSERSRPPPSLPRASFDRTKYDRLRVLTTELKRIVRDGGQVAVHFGPLASVPPRWLSGVLRLV
jgi:hypothetical protein